MATVLLIWELGGGIGHLVRLAPLATGLVQRGHRVYLVAKDLANVEKFFAGSGVQYLPAPSAAPMGRGCFRTPVSFSHVLHNTVFGDDRCLVGLVSAWKTLFQLTQPELIVFDHAPSALLAARGFPARRVTIGSGFCIPPDASPYPCIRPQVKYDLNRLAQEEAEVLARVNRVSALFRQQPLDRLGQLYSQVDQQFLTTFAQLDHYPDRSESHYWGPINGITAGGKEPIWPDGKGKKIYAYLKPYPNLSDLLKALNESDARSLIYSDSIPLDLQKKFASEKLRFENERIDIAKAAQLCDIAITHGTLGTTSAMLQAGKPTLVVPLMLEQAITGRNVERLGAGLNTLTNQPQQIREHLRCLLNSSESFHRAAIQISAELAGFDPERQQNQILDRLQELLDLPCSSGEVFPSQSSRRC